ncbi:MAG: hypothetical protein RMJ51_01980 [Candidatus Calescibacterium sp.]|nr:hypothetical protein [Candidatus Calescibacterium sp.]MCX7971903.1 hypothetical protein [bacterium]MDW8194998.1 hypothetical protein [Candidatus Calescibacterium sp.]
MKETIYLILQDIQLLIENLKKQNIDEELKSTIEKTQNLIAQINISLEENNEKEIYKKLLEIKALEFKIIYEEVKNSNFYKFWETLIENIKKNLVTKEELYEFYKTEMNKLIMNAEIVSNIIMLEDEDITFKVFIDIMFGEAFKTYYTILQKLHEFVFNDNISLLDEIKENIPHVVFYFLQIQKLIPPEYSENVEKLLEQ